MSEIESADRAMMVEMAELYELGLSLAENDVLIDEINARRDDWQAELSARIKDVLGEEKAS